MRLREKSFYLDAFTPASSLFLPSVSSQHWDKCKCLFTNILMSVSILRTVFIQLKWKTDRHVEFQLLCLMFLEEMQVHRLPVLGTIGYLLASPPDLPIIVQQLGLQPCFLFAHLLEIREPMELGSHSETLKWG